MICFFFKEAADLDEADPVQRLVRRVQLEQVPGDLIEVFRLIEHTQCGRPWAGFSLADDSRRGLSTDLRHLLLKRVVGIGFADRSYGVVVEPFSGTVASHLYFCDIPQVSKCSILATTVVDGPQRLATGAKKAKEGVRSSGHGRALAGAEGRESEQSELTNARLFSLPHQEHDD